MQFFHDAHGEIYPVSDIVKIGRETSSAMGLETYAVHLRDDRRVWIFKSTRNEIERSGMTIIPAQPGTYRLTLYAPSRQPEKFWVEREIVLAWRIDDQPRNAPQPIVSFDDWTHDRNYSAIEHPTGEIVDSEGQVWTTVDAFAESAKAWVIADREDQASSEGAA